MSHLKKKLNSLKDLENNKIKNNKEVNQSEVLLLEPHSPEKKMLDKLGLNHELEYQESLTKNITKINTLETIYDSEAYSGTYIKKLCQDFHLQILPVEFYNGTVPKDLPQVVSKFLQDRSLDDVKLNNKLFILAPVETFGKGGTIKNYKPILFYREGNDNSTRLEEATEEDVFLEIKDWGSKFSKWRYALPYFSINTKVTETMSWFILLTVASIVFSLLGFSIATTIFLLLALIPFIKSNRLIKNNNLWRDYYMYRQQ